MTLFDEYGRYHRDRRNRICHEIGIPLIVLSLEALLRLVAIGPLNLAELITVALILYYFALVRAEATVAALALVALYLLSTLVSWPLALALFAAGWGFQFVGHAYEGNRPAFLRNLVHLLVGPLWICHLAVQRRHS
ncbi:MAG TPA: Mpo1-like protein [Candidatus Limnocylindria bacterium]|jgi:uncharacterized membrane protein YGL010W|nr:Mpo1-like protein [Candidatus Limnocylindria bacterium]